MESTDRRAIPPPAAPWTASRPIAALYSGAVDRHSTPPSGITPSIRSTVTRPQGRSTSGCPWCPPYFAPASSHPSPFALRAPASSCSGQCHSRRAALMQSCSLALPAVFHSSTVPLLVCSSVCGPVGSIMSSTSFPCQFATRPLPYLLRG